MEFFGEIADNKIFWIVVAAWLFSCVLKGFIEMFRTKSINLERFFGPGGMPSSHSTIVTSVTTCVGIYEGFDSALFVVCFVLSLVVMYDASGVRRAAGEHAKMINIMAEAWGDQMTNDEKLKEILGHTPLQVIMGALLGVVFSVVVASIIG